MGKELVDTAILEESSHQQVSTITWDERIAVSQFKINTGESVKAYQEMYVPLRYQSKSFANFEGSEKERLKAIKALDNKGQVFITGTTGTGKTHFGIGLLLDRFAENLYYREEMDRIDFKYTKPRFLSSVDFFLELKESFKGDGEKTILDKYAKPYVLFVDDIGAEKVTDWSRQIFYTLIDRRYVNMKSTIITSNLNMAEFAEKFDDRVASRIADMGEVITLKGKDRRLEK
jgi:DNA replication protein DnaC